MSLQPRSEPEIEKLRESGRISALGLKKAIKMADVGVNLLDIESAVSSIFEENGAKAAFKTVSGYHWTTCLTVNNEVVHGIPRDYVLKDGDILSIDLGAMYDGWCTDCAWSLVVGKSSEHKDKFLKAGEASMWAGVDQAKGGNKTGDIGFAMQNEVETKAGFKIVRSLIGHGVGRELHEDPEIPGYGRKGTGVLLKNGMSVAVEAIYTESTYDVTLAADNWTYVSADGSLAGMFEMSVIVGKNGPEVLTDWRKV